MSLVFNKVFNKVTEFNIELFNHHGFGLESNSHVRLIQYQDDWKKLFEIESGRVMSALDIEGARIFHIGSTSIPGIHAKPILDMLMAVESLNNLDSKSKIFESLGYSIRGEYGLEGRRYFVLSKNDKTYIHLHCWEKKRAEIMQHLLFRSFLRLRPELAKKYDAIKLNSIGQNGVKRSEYQETKNPIINEILMQALVWADSPEAKLHYSDEWIVAEESESGHELTLDVNIAAGNKAKTLIDPFYSSVGSAHRARDEDTFFILSSGNQVVGTVRHCFENDVSMLRSMMIHPDYRGKNFGRLLLKAFEAFLDQNQIKKTFCLPYSHLLDFYGQIGFKQIDENSAPAFLRERLREYRKQYPEKKYSVMMRHRKVAQ